MKEIARKERVTSEKFGSIQRLMILHLGLLPSDGFDESASLDELCEHILYYWGNDSYQLDHRCRYKSEEAVKFAGLCSAFWSLHTTFEQNINTSSDGREDYISHTKEVYLTNCILVFTPLELLATNGLISVAQISKQQTTPTTGKREDGDFGYVTPDHVRNKILKAHDLYLLMKGYSINEKLSTTNISVEQKDQISPNHGMKELYNEYLKVIRVEQTSFQYEDNSQNEKSLMNVNDLISTLPLDALRVDLKQFYNSFVRDF